LKKSPAPLKTYKKEILFYYQKFLQKQICVLNVCIVGDGAFDVPQTDTKRQDFCKSKYIFRCFLRGTFGRFFEKKLRKKLIKRVILFINPI